MSGTVEDINGVSGFAAFGEIGQEWTHFLMASIGRATDSEDSCGEETGQ